MERWTIGQRPGKGHLKIGQVLFTNSPIGFPIVELFIYEFRVLLGELDAIGGGMNEGMQAIAALVAIELFRERTADEQIQRIERNVFVETGQRRS